MALLEVEDLQVSVVQAVHRLSFALDRRRTLGTVATCAPSGAKVGMIFHDPLSSLYPYCLALRPTREQT